MKNRTIFLLIILVLVTYYNRTNVSSLLYKIKDQFTELTSNNQNTKQNQNGTTASDQFTINTEDVKKENTPGPLEKFLNDTLNQNTLDQTKVNIEGIISNTNTERIKEHKKPLKENISLNKSAYTKAKDMLDRQYFEHTSPDGKGVSNLVKTVGYEYITVGENLALGNFTSSEDIVKAWMNSPGHRANILNSAYTEIGVGIVSGVYEGRTVWIAVQHFGRPLSDCPETSSVLKNQIDKEEKYATEIRLDLEKQKSVISAPNAVTLPNYTTLVDTYNELVKKYNSIISKTKSDIVEYNKQIYEFNKCIGQTP